VYSKKTPDDGQTNCLKHVEFYSKNKFEKLVQLAGFIVRIYHEARSPEHQTQMHTSTMCPVYVHHPKILQNGYNNVQEQYKKILTNL